MVAICRRTWPMNPMDSYWIVAAEFSQTQFCGALGVFADALVGPARPEARAIKAAKRKSASANALCLDAPSVIERTFSSMPFIGGHFTMRLAVMTKSHRAMKTGIGDIHRYESLSGCRCVPDDPGINNCDRDGEIPPSYPRDPRKKFIPCAPGWKNIIHSRQRL